MLKMISCLVGWLVGRMDDQFLDELLVGVIAVWIAS